MRWWELLAPHPWLRAGLVVVTVAVVVAGGMRLWTNVPPDAVRITVTQVNLDPASRTPHRVIYDRTIQNSTVAERLHHDFAGMPISGLTFDPFAAYGCFHVISPYDIYTLTWLRAGVPIEQANTDESGCRGWSSDGLFVHQGDQDALNADIAAAIAAND
jgi:hypothetical protein